MKLPTFTQGVVTLSLVLAVYLNSPLIVLYGVLALLGEMASHSFLSLDQEKRFKALNEALQKELQSIETFKKEYAARLIAIESETNKVIVRTQNLGLD